MKKRLISSLAAAAILSSAFAGMAITADAAVADGKLAVGDTVKFDFGAEGQTAQSGYYSVTPSTEFNANIDSATGLQFGFYGNNTNDYKLNEYVDGVRMIQGQIVTYQSASAPGSGADSDSVGPAEVTNGENGQINGLYPIRFSMRDENNGYYKVKVTVTGLDSSKPATATVYSERRHPIITEETIAAGATKVVEFTATTQNVAVKNRSTGGTDTYKDDTVNVMAVGENIAISSIEITKVEHQPTIWCYDDSTGCDYSTRLPFFPYQNYGGTAQYLSKYLSKDIVLANQGDGGINAADSAHWKAAINSISAGDYIYMQYGHNHKNDGAAGYVHSISKYYTKAHEVGAKMIYVGPIDRHNSTQYNSSTNTWSTTLAGFSKAAKYYTELLITGGPDLAAQFVAKVPSTGGVPDAAYTWADAEIAKGITSAGVTDVAFVDLNAPTLTWLSEVCDDVKTRGGHASYDYKYTNYYFQATKGSAVDGTHPNDLGADCTAKMFFDGAKAIVDKTDKTAIEAVEANVLSPLLTGMRDATPYKVSDAMISTGLPTAGYPDVYKSSNAAAYPTAVKNVSWDDDGTIASVSILKQESTLTMSAYGVLELIIKDNGGNVKGTITSTQVDNTWTDGSTTTFSAADDTNKLLGNLTAIYDKSAGDTFTATIWQATDNGDGLNKAEPNVQYSEVYVPTELESVLITDEDGNAGEDFDFYGVLYNGTGNLNGQNGWAVVGSASKDTSLNSDNGIYYANIAATSASGSFMASKKLAKKISASGRVKFSMSLKKYETTTDPINLGIGTVSNSNWPDSGVVLLRVNGAEVSVTDGSSTKSIGTLSDSAWTTVSGTLDFDRGTLTTKFGDGEEVTTTIPNYSTASAEVSPATFTDFYAQGTSNKQNGVKISALSVDKYSSDDSLESYTVTVASVNDEYGTASISGTDAKSISATQGSVATVKAVANGTMSFVNWTDGEGNIVSDSAEYSFRVNGALTLTANFGYYGTINAVDENGAVLKELGKIPGAPGKEYKISSLPEVIEKDGAYYELSPLESGISYVRSFTMGNADETKTVTYNKKDNIVYFAEAEDHRGDLSVNISSIPTNENSSSGKGLYVDKSNNSAKFDITFAEDGQYTIFVGYVNGRERTQDVYLDDEKIGSFKGTTASTAAVCEIKSLSINAGTHTLKLTTNYNLSPYLDYVKITAEKTGTFASYAVNAVDAYGTVIKQNMTSGTAFTGEKYTPALPYIIEKDGIYYQLKDTASFAPEYTLEGDGEVRSIEYDWNGKVAYFGEAENMSFTAKNKGTSSQSQKSIYSNGTGVEYTGTDSYLTFPVTIPETGTYTIKIHEGPRASSKNTPYTTIVNDGETKLYDFAGNVSSDFVDTHEVELTAGQHDIRVIVSYSAVGAVDYLLIEADKDLTEEPKPEPTLQDEVDESGNATISGTYDGESATVPANATVTIAEDASIKNGTLTAESGKITVKVGDSTISNASSVQFDSSGKVKPSDGAVISTPNGTDGETDKGFFITKSFESAANETTFKINGEEYTAAFDTTMSGDVLFGIFVTGIPSDKTVTVTAE